MADYIYKENKNNIIAKGTVRPATKLPVVTIGLGRVRDLRELPGVVSKNENGDTVIVTKEHLNGIAYPQSWTAITRVIDGKVLINGHYDLYAVKDEKLPKLLGNRIDLSDHLDETQLAELQPIFGVASEITPSLAPANSGRKVIEITKEMLGDSDHIQCELPLSWNNGQPSSTPLYEGDIFVMENEETGKGYRIGREEFAGTHRFDD